MNARSVAVLAFSAVAIPLACSQNSKSPLEVHTAKHSTTAIVGVTTIPMDVDRMVAEQTVVAVDGRIVQVGPKNNVTIPSGALRIDGAHLYLLPGLADMHVHFQWTRQINERLLSLFVASGVTTVLNMRGESAYLGLRDDVAPGKILGPAIYTTGPFIGDPHGGPLHTTPGEVAACVAADKAAEYDFVKFMGDLSRESYEQLLASGKKEGIRVIGHLPPLAPPQRTSEDARLPRSVIALRETSGGFYRRVCS